MGAAPTASSWHREFRQRMGRFESMRPPRSGEVSVSLKVRVVSGCFHREHSPLAYEIIDDYVESLPNVSDFQVIEHESGPEILVYCALATAGISLAKSVIDLITAILKARSDSVKKGDRPSEPVELVVRRIDDRHGFHEETVLRLGHADKVVRKTVEQQLKKALSKLLSEK